MVLSVSGETTSKPQKFEIHDVLHLSRHFLNKFIHLVLLLPCQPLCSEMSPQTSKGHMILVNPKTPKPHQFVKSKFDTENALSEDVARF